MESMDGENIQRYMSMYPSDCDILSKRLRKLKQDAQKKSSHSFKKQDIFRNPLRKQKNFAKV